MNDNSVGLILLVVAGLTNACFTRPMNYARKWAWENTWLVFTVVSLWVLPPVVTLLMVPDLDLTYGQVGKRVIATAAAFGLGWGVSQVFFALAVEAIGMVVAFSLMLGLSAAMGSLFPLIYLQSGNVHSPAGLAVLEGAALAIVGVSVCAIAGWQRDRALGKEAGEISTAMGILFAILSGVGVALLNLALISGGPLLFAAELNGADRIWAPNAVWLPLMIAGSIPNVLYCGYLLKKNGSLSNFAEPGSGSHWALALLMGVFWFGSIILYGISAQKLGSSGTILGWPLFMALTVIAGTLLSVITGEWKGAGKWPLRIQTVGTIFLVLAVLVLAAASRRV
ncbi:MAG: hypothetical protein LAN37_09245 [Acidobacteriia bacterium]|nr:hypothetical protein [Terriglobia bacterium]